MKINQKLFSNFNKITKHSLRKYSLSNEVEKLVIISESNDIFTNLALEDWYYRNEDFKNKHMLMLWSNNPCVVIGKFQNPWLEANVSELGRLIPGGVQLARRNSGGGTVYHDRGNLNLTFFTPREHYNRRHNLEIISKAILKEYNLKIDISKRDDLVIENLKVSGTAAKLARIIAYHHCTLLVNSDKTILSSSLKKPNYDIITNATQSVKSKIINIADVNKIITVENLMVCIGREYLSTVPAYINKEKTLKANYIAGNLEESIITRFRVLRPTEDEFPGLTEIRDTLKSWEWKFGKSPKFVATKSYPNSDDKNLVVKIIFTVDNGYVKEASVEQPENQEYKITDVEISEFKDRKFAQELFDELYTLLCDRFKAKDIREI